jgi:hypothetical protein
VEHQNFYIIIQEKRSRSASKEAEGGYEISQKDYNTNQTNVL